MIYSEAVEYMNNLIKFGSVLGLDSIKELLRRLSNPEKSLRVIHVAGTNGKGSTIAFMEEIWKTAGYNVGVYTSPVVFEYREKIRAKGSYISEEEYAECVATLKEAIESMLADHLPSPTIFEAETALALLYFQNKKCDPVILETGMGGATDATNVCEKVLCAVITSISMDHMEFLGDSLREIASVKAGIIKKGCPVVCQSKDDETYREVVEVINKRYEEVNSETEADTKTEANTKIESDTKTESDTKIEANTRIESDIGYERSDIEVTKETLGIAYTRESIDVELSADGSRFNYISKSGTLYKDIEIHLLGTYQIDNAKTAIETMEMVAKQGYNVSGEDILEGLKKAKWRGRFEKISEEPRMYIDGAHNPDAARRLRETMEAYFEEYGKIYIMGVLRDKDFREIVDILLKDAMTVYTITPHNARGLDGRELAEVINEAGIRAIYVEDYKEAIELAKEAARAAENNGKKAVILAFGSLSYFSEMCGE